MQKNIQNKWSGLMTALAFLCIINFTPSCKKVLDVKNLAGIDETTVWSDPTSINLLVNYIYTLGEPDDWAVGYANAITFRYGMGIMADEGRPSNTFLSRTTGSTGGVNDGVAFTATSAPFQRWSYATIRQCNDFIAKINTLYILPPNASPATVQQRDAMLGQVLFFRAFVYWKMVSIYGGVPIVDKVLDAGDPELYNPRNTQEECFQFIKNDLMQAADLLPDSWTGNDQFRITKGAAWALLGRILLFRASPMYNTTNNQSYWQDASDASKKVLDAASYTLYDKFGRWFFDKTNPESIWQVDFSYPLRTHGWDAANHIIDWAINDAVATCPTEELVEAFPMLNGKAITDPTSGYNPGNPYTNRDPRLRATVTVNGDFFGQNPQVNGGAPLQIWTYVGGHNGYSESSNYQTSTGYYIRKAMDTTLLSAVPRVYTYGSGSSSNWVEIRLAEVMLNYAEAQNELGNATPAYTYIKQIRQRAGIQPGGDGNFGIPAGMSTGAMRSFIQNERFIEFAFENKRYWDLKRWNLAESVLSKPTHSMVITKLTPASAPPTTNGSDYKFDPTVINLNDRTYPPVFLKKFYFLPIPQSQLQLNSKLIQNPLWQ